MFKVIQGLLEGDWVAESSRRRAAAAPCSLEIRLSLEYSLSPRTGDAKPPLFTQDRTQETGNRKQDTGHRKQDTRQETRNRKQDAGNEIQDTGHRTQVTGHRSQDTGHRSQVAGHRTQDTGHASYHGVLMTMFVIYVYIISYKLYIV